MEKRIKTPRTIILRSAGTNCEGETQFAFQSAGSDTELVHINQLLSKEKRLADYHILVLPGGFSYGDDIAAGKILANELRLKLGHDIRRFMEDGKLIIGICNGFQILVKAGILPGPLDVEEMGSGFTQTATLMTNDCGKFEDRWILLKSSGQCVWTKDMGRVITLPVAHGEGKFIPKDESVLKKLKENNQIIFRYCDKNGGEPKYPENPNGAVDHIAGICDRTGRIFGLMPHPERHFLTTQHPSWTRLNKKDKFGDGAKIFENGINYVREKLLNSPSRELAAK